jgi:CRISPR-associated protein (TIGR02710 family)
VISICRKHDFCKNGILISNDWTADVTGTGLFNEGRVYEKADYMVMSVGTSYEPLVLSINLFRPTHILFLYTELSTECLDKVVDFCGLHPSGFSKSLVNETDPLSVYREIKNAYIKWNKPKKLYIDFTGGTKAMSAACAQAGSVIDVQLVYVGSNNYLPDFRKPDPGSEELYFITNPLAVFGDVETEKAYALFGRHNYAGAREKLEELKESIPDPGLRQQLEFVYLLAKEYEQWDALDFVGACGSAKELNSKINRDSGTNSVFVLMDKKDVLLRQQAILEPLAEIPGMLKADKKMEILSSNRYMFSLMFTMYQNASVREEQEKLDMATLLLYRLLEMIEQKRLAEYGLFVSQMNYGEVHMMRKHFDWNDMPADQKINIIREKFVSTKGKLFSKPGKTYMPEQISLLEGFILLYSLDDEIISEEENEHAAISELCKIRSMVSLRNNSIFAHGLAPVSIKDYEKFRDCVIELFIKFCRLEGTDFDDLKEAVRWISPTESKYYVGPEV